MIIILVNANCGLMWIERSDPMKNQEKQRVVTYLKDTAGSQHIQGTGGREQHFAMLGRARCF